MSEYRVGLIERSTGVESAVTVTAVSDDEARKGAMRDGWLVGKVRRLPSPRVATPTPRPPVMPVGPPAQSAEQLSRIDLRRLRAATRGGVMEGGCGCVLLVVLIVVLVNILVCSGLFSPFFV